MYSDALAVSPAAPTTYNERLREALTAKNMLAFLQQHVVAILAFAFIVALVMMPQVQAHASTQITIDTDSLFASVNEWIATFTPIQAIGIGISVAIAILAFVAAAVTGAFKR